MNHKTKLGAVVLVLLIARLADSGAQSVSYTDVTVNGITTGSPTKPSLKSSGKGGVAFMGTGSGVNTTSSYSSGWDGFVFDAGLSSVSIGTFYTGDISGKGSLGVGSYVSVTGENSVAFGYESSASGDLSFASGDMSSAPGFASSALNCSTSLGWYSTALNEATSTGGSSTAVNMSSVVGGYAFGQGRSSVGGDFAAGFGETTVPSYASVAIGQFNEVNNASGGLVNGTLWVAADPVLSVGIGANASARKDAFTIYKDGKIRMTKRQGDIPMGQFGNGGGD